MILLVLLLSLSWLNNIFVDLPSPEELTNRNIEFSTNIYDRNRNLLYTIYKDKNREPIVMAEIPNHVVLALLAAEDANFFNHRGFSPKGMARALYKYLRYGEISGGSTITQQLVKNTLLTPERTVARKLREIVLAARIEKKYSKTEILQMYLNEAPFGGTIYGIKEAANTYFNKEVADLTLAEAALLAGIPKSPTKFNPFGDHLELALKRKQEILDLMVANGFVSKDEIDIAKKEKIILSENKTKIAAPHFVMFVREMLVSQLGEDMVEKGGLNITTTLDLALNEKVEKIISDEVDSLQRLNVSNGAALVINPESGEILAMVGSKDYYNLGTDGNVNVLTQLRQPGSAIKLINYAYALEHGFTLATIIDDSPASFPIPGHSPYAPKNYDGKYRGKMTLRDAFAQSRNIPAVRVLNSYGVDKMISQGAAMGITSWEDKNRFGLALTLGGGEVYITDLATAYATVANYGKLVKLNPILKITDHAGNEINLKPIINNEQVVNPEVAYLLIDTLKDNRARTPAFGPNSLLNIKGHPEVAVKTGTSNALRDNLAVGFSQDYLVAAWVGNNDNTPMSRVASGVTGATPIWNKIMNYLLQDTESKPWEVPSGLVQSPICKATGTLPCGGCLATNEWFVEGTQPKYACNSEQFITKDLPAQAGKKNKPES